MTLQDAVHIRCSRRKYLDTPIDYATLDELKSLIGTYSREAGLNIQLALNHGDAFNGLRKSYGMFSGVQNYIGLIDKQNDEHAKEKLGYYGELLVLHATIPGLGTCWVGGTFDRTSCPFTLLEGESIACVITIGNVRKERSIKEKLVHNITHRKTKAVQEMFTADGPVPDWFMSGMHSVQKAPSAVNRQPVMFTCDNERVTASVKDMEIPGMALDLGIAKLHFALGAGEGQWDWGNGAEFHRKQV